FYAGHAVNFMYLDLTGTGSWSNVAGRRYGIRDYGSAVMYDVGKILYVGGGRTTNTAEIIDLNSGSPSWEWTGSMAFARRHLNATVLPTGDVLVTGGSSGTEFNDVTAAVRAAEIWSPATGTWTTLASGAIGRTYHATSILMPDGRVLHSGSGDPGSPEQRNAEFFSPPYLFKGPRPTITSAPSKVAYGFTFRVSTPHAADIAEVSLIRLGSVTHAFDMNQRFQRLSFEREGGALTITAPSNRNRTPPGHYMLFILNGDGVPSEAPIVNVGHESSPGPPSNAPPAAGFTESCDGFDCAFTDRSEDGDGTVTDWSWDFGDGAAATDRHPNHTYSAEGSYEVTLIATDDAGAKDTIARTVAVAAPLPNAAPDAGFTGSCDGFDCAFTDGSTDGDGTVTGWSWDFGDGGSSAIRNPSHTYAAEGSYQVTLIATDNDAATGTVTKTVVVTPPAPNTAPEADFSESCTALACSFTDGSSDEDGSVTGWSWEFGDGGSAGGRSPSHTYADGGEYQVTLIATDNDEAADTVTRTVTVTPPPPNERPTAEFTASCDGLTCGFTDTSSDGDGSVTGWSWDFGDGGSSTARNPSHTYGSGGAYEVTLTARDDGDATGTVTQTVTVTAPPPNSAPTAAFTESCSGLTCTFTDGSSDGDGTVRGWSWNFGDGGSSTERNPSHTYAADGSFEVTLVATDDDGDTGTMTRTVAVSRPPATNAPPAAAFTHSCTGLSCRFTDRSTDSDGTVTAWRWTFGNGTTSSNRNPSRTYAAAGTYTVALKATDDDGGTHQWSTAVTVRSAIVLSVTGRKDATKHYMTLTWSGAKGTSVAVYRNGTFLRNEANDGRYVNTRTVKGTATYVFKVCEVGTTICSNEAKVVIK
ncbi:MAG: PKD domain-containing protein, partial [Gemmatimonadales bacterium]|nr:PKD domain-containing protein [Gemmatimonadales bacterium]